MYAGAGEDIGSLYSIAAMADSVGPVAVSLSRPDK
jgi:hypothetical protein